MIPEKPQADEWINTQATVVSCRRRLLGWATWSEAGWAPPEYVVTFSYNVDGQILYGKYVASTPQEYGHTFEILYDPEKPHKNSGTDPVLNTWRQLVVLVVGIILAWILIRYLPDSKFENLR